ncbi:MAG TPA: acyltransferase [Chitinophagaceae bacterium]|nr:acyltransferase [Chitinophagaceae bacterium]
MLNRIRNYIGFFASVLYGRWWRFGFFLFLKRSYVKGQLRVASGSTYKFFGDKTEIKIGPSAYIRHNCSIVIENGILEIGSRFFMNSGSSINVHNKVSIGDDCIFGEGVKIYDHNHVFKMPGKPFNQQGFSSGEIVIGNNVWLGSNVIILKDTRIGDNVVVGANCILKGTIRANSLVTAGRELSVQDINFSG